MVVLLVYCTGGWNPPTPLHDMGVNKPWFLVETLIDVSHHIRRTVMTRLSTPNSWVRYNVLCLQRNVETPKRG